MSKVARESAHDDTTDGVTVVRTGANDIDPGARVWHFDQLSDEGQTAIAAAVDGERSGAPVPNLTAGDVVRYTGYYEVC